METTSAPVRFLIVDDEPGICRIIARITTRAVPASTVQTADSAETALGLLDRDAGGGLVVTSDLRMGNGMDGIELLAAVRERRPSASRVLVTACDIEELRPRLAGARLDACIAKPFSAGEMAVLLRKLALEASRNAELEGPEF